MARKTFKTQLRRIARCDHCGGEGAESRRRTRTRTRRIRVSLRTSGSPSLRPSPPGEGEPFGSRGAVLRHSNSARQRLGWLGWRWLSSQILFQFGSPFGVQLLE